MKISDLLEAKKEHRSKSIERDEAENIISGLHAMNSGELWRGLNVSWSDSKEFYLVDPRNFTRKAAYTDNYVNLLVNNLPSWNQFPKRANSVVCSNQFGGATGYGTPYRVLPFNGATLGICSDNDFWNSFPYIRKILNEHGVSQLNNNLAYIWGKHVRDNNSVPRRDNLSQSNFSTLVKQFSILTNELEKYDETMREYHKGLKSEYLTYGSVLETLEYVLDPARNGFSVTTIENFKAPYIRSRKEVWTDSPCLLVRHDAAYKLFHNKSSSAK